ncbi:MAG TPA: MFS transporter, partial [Myxococcota bacterium]|nr:MFS transporter [Myxococcota bacterium]
MSATTSAFDFKPRDNLDEAEVQHGLKLLLVDGIASQVMTQLTGGAFLVAYALLLGASNTVIGLIASIAPLTQILQVPAIYLIEITRRRKLLAVLAALFSRSFWL